MSSYLPSFFGYLLVLIAVYSFFFCIGRLTLAVLPGVYRQKDDSFNVYISLILGLILTVSIFAIAWTKGRSVLWIVVLLFAFYIFDKRLRKGTNDRTKFNLSELKFYSLFLLVLVFLYLVAYYFLVVRIRLITPYGDPLFYSNLSYRLIDGRLESASLINGQIGPYHYFELWLNGIVAGAFHINHYASLFLITYSFLLALCIMGSYIICDSFLCKKWLSLCFAVSFLVFVPLSANVLIYANHCIFGKSFLFGNPALTMFKLSTIYVVVICSAILWMKKNEDLSVCMLLSLVALYSTVSAAVLIFVFLYSILIWKPFWKNKLFIINKYSLCCFFVGLFFAGFYVISNTNMSFDSGSVQGWAGVSMGAIILEALKLFVFELLLLIPSVTVLMICKYKKEKSFLPKKMLGFSLVVILTLLIVAFAASIFSQVNIDGSQMSTNFAMPLISLIPFVVFLYIAKEYSKWIGYSLIVVPVMMFIILPQRGPLWFVLCGHHDNEFYESTADFLDRINESNKENLPYNFGCFSNYEKCNIDGMRWTISYPMAGYMHLLTSNGFYFPKILSVMDIPENIDKKFNEKKSSELYKFIECQKECGSYVNEGNSICDFVSEKDINYIIVVNGAKVPMELQQKMQFIAEWDDNVVFKFVN